MLVNLTCSIPRFDRDDQVCEARPHRPGGPEEGQEAAGGREEEEAGGRGREPARRHGEHVRQQLIDSVHDLAATPPANQMGH